MNLIFFADWRGTPFYGHHIKLRLRSLSNVILCVALQDRTVVDNIKNGFWKFKGTFLILIHNTKNLIKKPFLRLTKKSEL